MPVFKGITKRNKVVNTHITDFSSQSYFHRIQVNMCIKIIVS